MPISRSRKKSARGGRKVPPAAAPVAKAASAPAERPATLATTLRSWRADDTALWPALLLVVAAPLAVLVSQTVPHTYYFGELGFLYPFTVYDIALAILGLGVLCAGFEDGRRFALVAALFVASLLVLLFDFISLWQVFLAHGWDEQIYLVTPVAVGLTGIALWLPKPARFPMALVLAVLVAFDIGLFVGLNEFSNDINTFSFGSVLAVIWILVAPAFLVRRFKRPWLTIAGRILGSWLVAIELMIFTFAVVPMPVRG